MYRYSRALSQLECGKKQVILKGWVSVSCLVIWLAAFDTIADDQSGTTDPSEDETHTITFTRLVYRSFGGMEINVSPEEYRITFIDELRRRNYNVVGAENIIFGKDNSYKARMLLGGINRSLDCEPIADTGMGTCRFEIEWEMHDQRKDKSIFKKKMIHTRRVSVTKANAKQSLEVLSLGAFRQLLSDGEFNKALQKKGNTATVSTTSYGEVEFRACEARPTRLDKEMTSTLDGTVVVKNGNISGAGFVLTTDGLIATAYHVVEDADEITIRTHQGQELPARLMRYDREFDVALLLVAVQFNRCLPLSSQPARTGDGVYVIGTPAGEDLSFSVSKGIVSGLREWEEHKFIQTDASINPGNSGGPMVDTNGRTIGIVIWKLHHLAFEGIGFGVPISTVLEKLALRPGKTTDYKTLELGQKGDTR